MEKFCKSCGMPMDKPEDFANKNPDSDYCYYCGEKEDYSNKAESYEKDLEKEEYYMKKAKKKKSKRKGCRKKK